MSDAGRSMFFAMSIFNQPTANCSLNDGKRSLAEIGLRLPFGALLGLFCHARCWHRLAHKRNQNSN
jgi:hypothetical protein